MKARLQTASPEQRQYAVDTLEAVPNADAAPGSPEWRRHVVDAFAVEVKKLFGFTPTVAQVAAALLMAHGGTLVERVAGGGKTLSLVLAAVLIAGGGQRRVDIFTTSPDLAKAAALDPLIIKLYEAFDLTVGCLDGVSAKGRAAQKGAEAEAEAAYRAHVMYLDVKSGAFGRLHTEYGGKPPCACLCARLGPRDRQPRCVREPDRRILDATCGGHDAWRGVAWGGVAWRGVVPRMAAARCVTLGHP